MKLVTLLATNPLYCLPWYMVQMQKTSLILTVLNPRSLRDLTSLNPWPLPFSSCQVQTWQCTILQPLKITNVHALDSTRKLEQDNREFN